MNERKNINSIFVKLEVSKSKPAVLLINPDDLGAVRRGTRDGSVSPVIWYLSTFLCWQKPTFHLPHVEVNLCSCQHFPQSWNLETAHKRHACAIRRDTTKRGRHRANIPTSWQKLTQAQMYLTNSPLLCVSKCEPDGSEQWGLARCLIVCGGYRRGTLELIRVEEQAFCRKAPNPSVTHHDTVI